MFQSNHEGDIIDELHRANQESDGVVLNAGALTHYSYAIHEGAGTLTAWQAERPETGNPLPLTGVTEQRLATPEGAVLAITDAVPGKYQCVAVIRHGMAGNRCMCMVMEYRDQR